jgi:type IV secretory pathway TraG/TraD family ATPase VirD4
MVDGTDAAAILNKNIHKTALNVRATIASRVQPLRYLWKYRPEYSPFSLRTFVKSDKPGWLFVTAKHDHFEGMRSLYTVWFDILTEAILSDMSGDQRKLVLVMDEFPALGRLRSIKSLMAQGRSYGACCILGFQNIHQLRQTYGTEEAENIAGLCNTWVCFSQPDPLTAKWHSDALGQIEVDEYQETVSYGGNRADLRMTPSRQIRPLVTPDQIMRLPKGSAWLRLADDYPISKVQTKVIDYPKVNPRFVQADWNRTIWGPWEGHETAPLGPARVNPGRPDLRLLE